MNIHLCPWTVKGFNIPLLMLIINCQKLHLTLLKPKNRKKAGIFTKVATKIELDFNQNLVRMQVILGY